MPVVKTAREIALDQAHERVVRAVAVPGGFRLELGPQGERSVVQPANRPEPSHSMPLLRDADDTADHGRTGDQDGLGCAPAGRFMGRSPGAQTSRMACSSADSWTGLVKHRTPAVR